MKNIKLIIPILLISLSYGLMAQNNSDFGNIDPASLSPTDREAYFRIIKNNPQKITPNQVAEWAEAGKALGGAFKECWSTISTDAERFANSPAGKLTAILVTWKVAGRDFIDLSSRIMRWIVGIGILIPFSIYMAYAFAKNCMNRTIKTKTLESDGKKIHEYRSEPGVHSDFAAVYALIYGAAVGICALIMFV